MSPVENPGACETPASAEDGEAYPALFDRSEDHAALVKSWKEVTPTLPGLGSAELTRLHQRLRRDYDVLRAINFYPGDASTQAEVA